MRADPMFTEREAWIDTGAGSRAMPAYPVKMRGLRNRADAPGFGEATGDMNPVHFDEEYARKTIFRARVAHGALTIGFLSALLGTRSSGSSIAIANSSIMLTCTNLPQWWRLYMFQT